MKLPTLFALTAILTLTAGGAPAQPPDPPANLPPVKDGYVKVRVEVEVRGLLKTTDKSAAVFTRYRYYDQRDASKEQPLAEGIPPYRVELDFARAPELRELATVLDGKEVVVTGLSELRHVVPPPPPPGGFTGGMPPLGGGLGFYPPGPSWHLQPGLLVTGLKLVPGKR
jgi:hypothetical protein